jgi:hypothetical protein
VRRTAVRFLAAILVAALGALTAASTAQADGSVVLKAFYADSGDQCPMGYTKGTLGWHVGPVPGDVDVVHVNGYLVDRPLPADPSLVCRDLRWSVASFTAYSNGVVVDKEQVKVDNGRLDFTFDLSARLRVIGAVVIQVCRFSPNRVTPDYCGKPVEYQRPITISP